MDLKTFGSMAPSIGQLRATHSPPLSSPHSCSCFWAWRQSPFTQPFDLQTNSEAIGPRSTISTLGMPNPAKRKVFKGTLTGHAQVGRLEFLVSWPKTPTQSGNLWTRLLWSFRSAFRADLQALSEPDSELSSGSSDSS